MKYEFFECSDFEKKIENSPFIMIETRLRLRYENDFYMMWVDKQAALDEKSLSMNCNIARINDNGELEDIDGELEEKILNDIEKYTLDLIETLSED